MPTFKCLDDYALDLAQADYDLIRRKLYEDLQKGLIDRENYDEMLEDLRDEETEANTHQDPLASPYSPHR